MDTRKALEDFKTLDDNRQQELAELAASLLAQQKKENNK